TGVTDFERSIGTDIRRELDLTAEDVLLIMASNIVPGKGQVDLLAAMEMLVGEFSHLHLLIAGAPVDSHAESMKYYEAVRELAAQDTVAANVHLLGWRSDIRDILEASDVYVSTSYGESFPDTVREAMSAGKPVVVTDVGGTSELVRVGESGYLFQPGDVPSLVGYLRELAQAPALRMEMGIEGRRIIEERFSTAAYVREFEDMVLSSSSPGNRRWDRGSPVDTTIDSGIP
ncbi:MAG: glycosyltransferase, partial [Chloroflexi bacterium]|nr:glycosyltransferase [Chloroflexota bacterium]